MQIQCTITLVIDAEIETNCLLRLIKSRLSYNNRKTYYNTFAAPAVLAYGQPPQEAPKNIRDQPIDR